MTMTRMTGESGGMAATGSRGRFHRPAGRSPLSSLVSREVARFIGGALLAAILVGLGTFVVIGRDAEDEAIRVAETITSVQGHSVIEPSITPALLTRSPAAIADLDVIVRQRILTSSVVRVKIWDASGLIVYSDEHRLIGRTFLLDSGKSAALRNGAVDADVSVLTDSENQYERSFGKLLEVYLPVRGSERCPPAVRDLPALRRHQQLPGNGVVVLRAHPRCRAAPARAGHGAAGREPGAAAALLPRRS